MRNNSITPAQLKMLHVMLNKLGLIQEKASLVHTFSDGRTTSSREMTLEEARELIGYLKLSDESTAILRSIWHLAYDMNIIYGRGYEENEMNAAKLDAFCKTRGTVKKKLHRQTNEELKRTHKQFQAMYKAYIHKQTVKQSVEAIKREMQAYIESENYEKCAELQQRIKELEK